MKDLMPQLEGSIMPKTAFMHDLYLGALARYQLAAQYAQNKIVLEAGSGAGYGAAVLADKAKKVYGVDTSIISVKQSQKNYHKKNLVFKTGDVTALDFSSNFFDLITAFEVIEHVRDYSRVAQEFYRVLKPGGIAIISTPNKAIYSPGTKKPFYPFHYQEFELQDLKKIFKDYEIREIIGQFIKGQQPLIYSPWHPKRIIRVIFANLPFYVKLWIMKSYLIIASRLFQTGIFRPRPVKLSDIYFNKNFAQSRSLILILRKPEKKKCLNIFGISNLSNTPQSVYL